MERQEIAMPNGEMMLFMNKLAGFCCNIDEKTFKRLFIKAGADKALAEHVWKKWQRNRFNIITLWTVLDIENKKRLMAVIEKSKLSF